MPLLHGPDGKKLSKRHGAASVQELRDAGYLPEAVRNYLALLGWGYDDETTFHTTEELQQRFSLERVSQSPAVFDEQKLRQMNGRYLRELPLDELTRAPGGLHGPQRAARGGRDLAGEDLDAGRVLAAGAASSSTARPTTRSRAGQGLGAERAGALAHAREALAASRASRGPSRRSRRRCAGSSKRRASSRASVFQPIRVALAGTTVSPGIFETVALLGRDETLARHRRRAQPCVHDCR